MAAYVNVTQATRLRMQAVRRANTTPEMVVRKLLHAMGYRFRVHRRDLPGTPDIVFSKFKKVIFVHGCFWHGHTPCRRGRLPVNNQEMWSMKIERNQDRDQQVAEALRALGWGVLVIWACELGDKVCVENKLREFLDGDLKE